MNLQTEKSMELRKDVRKFAEDNPEIAAQMVKSWLREGMANERDSYRRGSRFSSCKTVDETAKAAAVVISLGAEKASQLYQYMDPDDVEQITLEVAKLGYVDAATTEDVLNEYYQMCLTNKAVTEGGLEYARAVLEKAFGEQAADNLLEKVTKSLKNREFSFLNKADGKSLFAALQHERPQTIALVLSYIDPEKAAAVVEELDSNTQVRVVESIANMESASPTAVKIIEAEMEKKFTNLLTSNQVKVGGVDYVAGVMNNLDRTSEKVFSTICLSIMPSWLTRSGSGCSCLKISSPWMSARYSVSCGTAIPRIWCWPSRAPTAGFQQDLPEYVHPYGPEHPGRSGDHHQRPPARCGGGPAAHRGDHPGSGGENELIILKGGKDDIIA